MKAHNFEANSITLYPRYDVDFVDPKLPKESVHKNSRHNKANPKKRKAAKRARKQNR
jgi:hypothetical protein